MLKGDLEQLGQRKMELLLESDINRQIIRIEVAQLKLKATAWRRGLLKARSAYDWMAPMAGIGFALWGMRSKTRDQNNGRERGKMAYLKLLAPIGIAALRRAYSFWRDADKRDESNSKLQSVKP